MSPQALEALKQYGIVPSDTYREPAEVERDEDVDESSPYRHDWPEMPLGVDRG